MFVLRTNSRQAIRKALSYGRLRNLYIPRSTLSKASKPVNSTTKNKTQEREFSQNHAFGRKQYGQDFGETGSSQKLTEPRSRKLKRVSFLPESNERVLSVDIGEESLIYNIEWLRDACPGPCCIDKSTTQKTFQTTDIPKDIGIRQLEQTPDGGIKITWKNDLSQYDEKTEHVSVYSNEFFENHLASRTSSHDVTSDSIPWNSQSLSLLRIPYRNFMEADSDLYQALRSLVSNGLVMIKGAPSSENSVELITKRIGNLRDSLYGRTWNVRSIPEAKNVAYTSTFLGLHMDLLYMRDPPGLQFLHCLKNTCQGGTAIFSDSFNAAKSLSPDDSQALRTYKTAYHYRNNNEHYYHEHKTLEYEDVGGTQALKYVNWSPPFQANYPCSQDEFSVLLKASRSFAELVEAPENMFRYDYEEGDCVIFNNRRVLHGRDAFHAEGGERWLRGAYVDTDVFQSRLRVLRQQFEASSN